MYDAIVIGGGIAGLYSTYLQIQEGRRVLLCEKGSLGGSIKTSHLAGFTLEHGPNVLLENPAIINLLSQLDLSKNLIYPVVPSYKQFVWYNGKARLVPRSPGMNFLLTPLISYRDKVALIPRALRRGILTPQAEDESVAVFAGRLVGSTAITRLVDPALKGIYGGNADALSARSLLAGIWRHCQRDESLISYLKNRKKERGGRSAGRKIFVLKGGMQTLTTALARAIPSESICQREATSLTHSKAGFTVKFADGGRVTADTIYLAAAGPTSAQLLRSLDTSLSERLSSMSYAALSVMHVAVPRNAAIPPNSFGILFPAGLSSRLLGVMYNSVLFPHLAPPDQHLLTVCLGGVGQQDICQLTSTQIFSIVARELREKLAIQESRMLAGYNWPYAIPQYEVGHWRTVEAMELLEAAYPGLHIISVDRCGVSVPDRTNTIQELLKKTPMPRAVNE